MLQSSLLLKSHPIFGYVRYIGIRFQLVKSKLNKNPADIPVFKIQWISCTNNGILTLTNCFAADAVVWWIQTSWEHNNVLVIKLLNINMDQHQWYRVTHMHHTYTYVPHVHICTARTHMHWLKQYHTYLQWKWIQAKHDQHICLVKYCSYV